MEVYSRISNMTVNHFIGARTTLLHKMQIDGDYKDVTVVDALDSVCS